MTNLSFFKWSTWIQRLSICKRFWRSFFSGALCLRPPHSSNASITITGSSSHGMVSTSADNGSSMSDLKSQSMSDELCPRSPWANCCQREGNRQARSQVTVHHRALVVMVESVQSNRNEITWCFWSTSQLAMLAARADFPTPGDPLIQIMLGPSTFLISFLISSKIMVRVSFIHDLHRGSLFSPSMCNKSSNSFFSACAMRISILRSQLILSLKVSSLSFNSIAFSFWESTKIYLTGAN